MTIKNLIGFINPNVNGGLGEFSNNVKFIEEQVKKFESPIKYTEELTKEEIREMLRQNTLMNRETSNILGSLSILSENEYLSLVREFHEIPCISDFSNKFVRICAKSVGVIVVAIIIIYFSSEDKRKIGPLLMKGILATVLIMGIPKILQSITEWIFS